MINILGLGDGHGHRGSVRESYLEGQNPSVMYLAMKDHKPKDAKGLYKTRSIVADNTSYDVGLSETVSTILEALYSGREDRAGVISTEDLLARINLLAEGLVKEGG